MGETLELTRRCRNITTAVKRIRVGVLSAGFSLVADPIKKKRHPQTIVDAQFSMPFGAAVAVLFGKAGLDQYTMQNIRSRELLELMARVDCYKDEYLDILYPAKWPAEVMIEMTDGKAFTSRIEYPKGDPENPLSREDIQDKFLDMLGTVYSAKQATNIVGYIENLEKIENVRRALDDLKS